VKYNTLNHNKTTSKKTITLNQTITLKRKLGEIQIYFKKIPLHQQIFLVVSVLSNSPWLPRNFSKNVQNETAKRFSVGSINVAVATRGRILWLFYSRINAPRVLLKLPRSDSIKQVVLMQIVDVEYK